MYSAAVIGALTVGVMGTLSLAHADFIMDISPAKAEAGAQVVVGGKCPCFHWQIKAAAGAGKIETQDILISTEGLLQANLSTPVGFQNFATSLYRVGAVSVLSKGGHVGLAFDGVQFGQDSDRGLKSVLNAGLHALVNIIQNDDLVINAKAGYTWSQLEAQGANGGYGPMGSRSLVDQGVEGTWNDGGPFTAKFSAHIGLEADSHFFDPSRMVFGAEGSLRARMFTFDQFEAGLSAEVSAEHDGFLSTLGLNPDYVSTSVMMDLTYLPDALHQHTN